MSIRSIALDLQQDGEKWRVVLTSTGMDEMPTIYSGEVWEFSSEEVARLALSNCLKSCRQLEQDGVIDRIEVRAK
jgi:hypothetical protein